MSTRNKSSRSSTFDCCISNHKYVPKTSAYSFLIHRHPSLIFDANDQGPENLSWPLILNVSKGSFGKVRKTHQWVVDTDMEESLWLTKILVILYLIHFWSMYVAQFMYISNIKIFSCVTRARFHKACKHKNLLSTERYCLTESGYRPQLQKFTLLWLVPQSKKLVKQFYLLHSFMKLGQQAGA